MKRWSFFVYGVGEFGLFLAVYAYMAGFVGNLVVPQSIDSPASDSFGLAVLIDLGLIALFGFSIRSWPGRRSSRCGRESCRNRSSAARTSCSRAW